MDPTQARRLRIDRRAAGMRRQRRTTQATAAGAVAAAVAFGWAFAPGHRRRRGGTAARAEHDRRRCGRGVHRRPAGARPGAGIRRGAARRPVGRLVSTTRVAPARATFPALGTTAVLLVTDGRALPDAERALRAELAAIDPACSRFRAGLRAVGCQPGMRAAGRMAALLLSRARRWRCAPRGSPRAGRSHRRRPSWLWGTTGTSPRSGARAPAGRAGRVSPRLAQVVAGGAGRGAGTVVPRPAYGSTSAPPRRRSRPTGPPGARRRRSAARRPGQPRRRPRGRRAGRRAGAGRCASADDHRRAEPGQTVTTSSRRLWRPPAPTVRRWRRATAATASHHRPPHRARPPESSGGPCRWPRPRASTRTRRAPRRSCRAAGAGMARRRRPPARLVAPDGRGHRGGGLAAGGGTVTLLAVDRRADAAVVPDPRRPAWSRCAADRERRCSGICRRGAGRSAMAPLRARRACTATSRCWSSRSSRVHVAHGRVDSFAPIAGSTPCPVRLGVPAALAGPRRARVRPAPRAGRDQPAARTGYPRPWRAVHWLAYACWPLALVTRSARYRRGRRLVAGLGACAVGCSRPPVAPRGQLAGRLRRRPRDRPGAPAAGGRGEAGVTTT